MPTVYSQHYLGCLLLAGSLVLPTVRAADAAHPVEGLIAFHRIHAVASDWLRQDVEPSDDAGQPGGDWFAAAFHRVVAELGGLGHDTGRLERAWTEAGDDETRLDVYLEAAGIRRNARLASLRTTAPLIVFAKRHNIRPSFIGYTEGLSDARAESHFHPGSALCLLDVRTGNVRDLIRDPLGMIRDPDVSYDGGTILFAWKKSHKNDDYHLYEMDPGTGAIRQITFGLGMADYEGAYLPDGTIVFASSRNEQGVPCFYTETSNLYKVNRDGSFLRRLAIDQVHTLYPKPTDDGRFIYTRWDYNDRAQVYIHPLFQMNLDGTGQAEFYGASSWFPTSLLHTRQIAGAKKFISVSAGHHTAQHGKVVIIDPALGRDEGAGVMFVAPVREHPYERVDRAMQDGPQFAFPYPLGEREFLVSYAPKGGESRYDLYWFDVDGRRELLAWDQELGSFHAVPQMSRSRGHVRPDLVDYRQDEATIYIEDVYQGTGLVGVKRGTAKRLRVVEVRYRAACIGRTANNGKGGGALNGSPIAVGQGSWDVKAIVGETPILADGSVLVRVPAMKSLYYQVLDGKGHMIATMRTWDTLRPGESKSCIGCHAYDNNAPTSRSKPTLALQQAPARLEPFHTGWRGFSFPRDVQPILDRHCVECHDGSEEALPDLRATEVPDRIAKMKWTRSYLNLTGANPVDDGHNWRGDPENQWVTWIDKMSEPTPLPPYQAGSARSRLIELIENGHENVTLSGEEHDRIAAWIDLTVPFAGDYHEGTDWSPEEQAKYDYYEDKRRVNKQFEAEELARYLDGLSSDEWTASEIPTIRIRRSDSSGAVVDQREFSPVEAAGGAILELTRPLQEGDRIEVSGAGAFAAEIPGLIPRGEIHAPARQWSWVVPSPTRLVYPKAIYEQASLKFAVRPLRDLERSAYRNLACNPFAPATANGDSFPVAHAASEYASNPVFMARNAIDGFEINSGHGGFPNQSWGPDKANGPALSLDLGRPVRVARVDLVIRADFSHDQHWNRAELVIDGRPVRTLEISKNSEAQRFTFPPVEGRRVELRNLNWEAEGWCALTEIRVWGLDADQTPTARIEQLRASNELEAIPLQ